MDISDDREVSGSLKFIGVCFVLAVSIIIAFGGISKQTLSNHESFVSVTAREMMENSEYIAPTFNGQPRFNKTPLPYWLIAATAYFTGTVDEFAARFPTAVMSVLSALCILYFVSKLQNFTTAFLSALMWSTSLGFVRYSHSARPEMALTFFMLITFLSFYAAINEENRKKQIGYSLVFWAALGLSVMAKAPSSILFMVLTMVVYMTAFKEWEKFRNILPFWGFVLFLIIVLPWPIAIAYKMNWDLTLWRQESVGRFAGNYVSGSKGWYYYLIIMFKFTLPWSAFLVPAIAAPFFKVWKEKRKFMWYLWICFFVGVAFLMVNIGKRQHYIMPLMPMAAILIGTVMEDIIFSRKAYSKKECVIFFRWHTIAALVAAIGALVYSVEPLYESLRSLINSTVSQNGNSQTFLPAYNGQIAGYCFVMGIVLLICTILSIIFYLRKWRMAACIAFFGGIAVVIAVITNMTVVLKESGEGFLAKFSDKAAEIIPADEDVFMFGRVPARVVHYFGRPVRLVKDIDEIKQIYDDNGWVLAYDEYLEKIKHQFELTEVASSRYQQGKTVNQVAIFYKSHQSIGLNK